MTRTIPELSTALRTVITGIEETEWSGSTVTALLRPIADDLDAICRGPFGIPADLPELVPADSRRTLTEDAI